MIDDIFRVTFHFEDPSGHSSCSCYMQQTLDNSSTNRDCPELANAVEDEMDSLIGDVLSDDFWFTSVEVNKVYDTPEPRWITTSLPQAGQQLGPGLPSNCCVLLTIFQSTHGNRGNGRMFWPGIPEAQSNMGTIDAAFQGTEWLALAQRLVLPFSSIGDTGEWALGVISQKILNAAPPAKDWAGAFAFATACGAQPIIAIQRRRTTRVVGAVQ